MITCESTVLGEVLGGEARSLILRGPDKKVVNGVGCVGFKSELVEAPAYDQCHCSNTQSD